MAQTDVPEMESQKNGGPIRHGLTSRGHPPAPNICGIRLLDIRLSDIRLSDIRLGKHPSQAIRLRAILQKQTLIIRRSAVQLITKLQLIQKHVIPMPNAVLLK